MARKKYAGAAVRTSLTGTLAASGATSLTTVDATGWPASGPYVMTIDRGTSAEEKILIASRSGSVHTIDTRGYDGTVGVSHASGAIVEHTVDAITLDEANDHVNTTTRDDHAQYLNTTRHDIAARHTFGAALGSPGLPVAVGTALATGSGAAPAKEDHVHELGAGSIDTFNQFASGILAGSGDVAAVGTAASAGVVDKVPRADHVHVLGSGSINAAGLFGSQVVPNTALTDATITAAKLATGTLNTLTPFASPTLPPYIGASAPGGPTTGQIWFDTGNGALRYWNGTHWSPVARHDAFAFIANSNSATLESVATGAWEGIPITTEVQEFPTVVENPAGMHTGTESSVIIPTGFGGDWHFEASITWDVNSAGMRAIGLGIGTSLPSSPTYIGQRVSSEVTGLLAEACVVSMTWTWRDLTAGSRIWLLGRQSSGGPLYATACEFRAWWLG
jgi:hypothetical protein